jgi:hypothetical protein
VANSESEYLFVWRLNLTLLLKADEAISIKCVMLCLHNLQFWFNSICKQQSYLGSNVGHIFYMYRYGTHSQE